MSDQTSSQPPEAPKSNTNPQTGQELEFLNVVILPNNTHGRDENSRRIVRSHAIRDANRRKRLEPSQSSEHVLRNSESKPKPQSNFVAKFRLDKKQKGKAVHAREGEVDKSHQDVADKVKPVEGQPQRLQRSLNPERFDPFHTLPGDVGPRVRAIVESDQTSKPRIFTCFSKERLFSYSLADPAWFNATLAIISLHNDLSSGGSISSESLYYRGEALKIVTERLSKNPTELEITNYTIAAIASLANFDTTTGSTTSACMHVDGLISIVNRRGGIQRGLYPFQANDMLEKVVAWSDLSYANLHDHRPRFPVILSGICTGSLEDYLEYAMARFIDPPDVTSPHDLFGQMSSVFQALRLLSFAKAIQDITQEVQYLFSRGLYITEYRLLVILDGTNPQDAFNDTGPDRKSHIYGSCRLAAYLYMYMVLMEVPPEAEIVRTLVRRLKLLIEAEDGNLLSFWSEDMHLLLWILSMGAITRCDQEDGRYFVGNLNRVVEHMGLISFESYKQAIGEVCWIKASSWNKYLLGLWDGLSAASSFEK